MDVEEQARILEHAYPVSVRCYVDDRDKSSLVSVLYDVVHSRLVAAIIEIESERD